MISGIGDKDGQNDETDLETSVSSLFYSDPKAESSLLRVKTESYLWTMLP